MPMAVDDITDLATSEGLDALLLIEKTCLEAGYAVQRVSISDTGGFRNIYLSARDREVWEGLPYRQRGLRIMKGVTAQIVCTRLIQ